VSVESGSTVALVRCRCSERLQQQGTVIVTEPQNTVAERAAELSEELLDSVESARKAATDAIRKFVKTVEEASPALVDESRRKTVIDAAVDLADSLVTTQIQFLRSVARSASEALSKKVNGRLSTSEATG
jgi:hypothetical protein